MKVFVRDKLVAGTKASVSVFDHGLLYGDGVYETLRSYNGVVFKMTEHVRRLQRSASLIKLGLPYDVEKLGSIIHTTLRENRLRNAYIRVTVTRGTGPIGLDITLCTDPTLIVITKQFTPPPVSLYRKGVRVIISSVRRNLREAINPQIKSLNFLNNIIAKSDAVKAKAFEAVMLNHRGHITEGTTSNIFMIRKGVLMTPPVESGILDGITRQTVLEIAGRNRIRTMEKSIRPRELYSADEVFLTNTSLEVMPVRQVDSAMYRKRELSDVLMSEYRNEVEKEINKNT